MGLVKTLTAMSSILKFLVACVLVTQVSAAESAAQQSEAAYKQGVAAEKAGDVAGANEGYSRALKLNPGNANARYSLGQLVINADAINARARETKFGNVTIPLIQLDNASLQEALDAFSGMIEKQSKNEVTPNFVIQDPKGTLAVVKISMSLKNMPSKGVMKYLMDQAGAKARYDEHAVVVTPR